MLGYSGPCTASVCRSSRTTPCSAARRALRRSGGRGGAPRLGEGHRRVASGRCGALDGGRLASSPRCAGRCAMRCTRRSTVGRCGSDAQGTQPTSAASPRLRAPRSARWPPPGRGDPPRADSDRRAARHAGLRDHRPPDRCPGERAAGLAPRCVLISLKNHPRRTWCSTACGTRARQARHYARKRRR
jgi:CGNR zinc finger